MDFEEIHRRNMDRRTRGESWCPATAELIKEVDDTFHILRERMSARLRGEPGVRADPDIAEAIAAIVLRLDLLATHYGIHLAYHIDRDLRGSERDLLWERIRADAGLPPRDQKI